MAKARKSVTMADIAKQLDVSIVTVSKALSDQKGVSEKLRKTILDTATELGYEFGGSSKTYTIGIVIADKYLDNGTSFYWKMYQEIVGMAGRRHLFVMYESISMEMTKNNSMPKMVEQKKVDGLILVGNPGFAYSDYLVQNAGLPVVFLDFYNKTDSVDCVISDGFYGAYQLTNYLIEKGHTRIAYVGTLFATESITDRYLGYTKALMENGLPVESEYVIPDRDVQTGMRPDYATLKFPKKMPSALVCNCDFIAGLMIAELRNRGYRVPEDISVVGYDNDRNPASNELGITTYEVDVTAMAEKAVQYLHLCMTGNQKEPGIHIVKGKLVEKDSVAVYTKGN